MIEEWMILVKEESKEMILLKEGEKVKTIIFLLFLLFGLFTVVTKVHWH